ncbi:MULTISPECIES: Mrp/NBP35 family ATP-binding protein [Fervidicoccus]|nr:Mrp/NBP35 family ATP-binding protein [Fervidicoccus fontis]
MSESRSGKNDLRIREMKAGSTTTNPKKAAEEIDQYISMMQKKFEKIKNRIMIFSGKGGVGKTFIAASIAMYLSKMGYKVGVYDADETGSVIPFVLGNSDAEIYMEESSGELIPANIKGIQVMSLELMLKEKDSPLIWQGALRTKFILQTLALTRWEDLDFLIFDMPPGTGDEAITISQYVPSPKYAIIVSSPGKLSEGVVRKAVVFLKKMEIPILGIVENMSHYTCDDGSKIEVFGKSYIEEIARDHGIEALGKIPLDERIRESQDKGVPIYELASGSEVDRSLELLAKKIIEKLSSKDL